MNSTTPKNEGIDLLIEKLRIVDKRLTQIDQMLAGGKGHWDADAAQYLLTLQTKRLSNQWESDVCEYLMQYYDQR